MSGVLWPWPRPPSLPPVQHVRGGTLIRSVVKAGAPISTVLDVLIGTVGTYLEDPRMATPGMLMRVDSFHVGAALLDKEYLPELRYKFLRAGPSSSLPCSLFCLFGWATAPQRGAAVREEEEEQDSRLRS